MKKTWAILFLLIMTAVTAFMAGDADAFLCVEPVHPALEFSPPGLDFGAVPINGSKSMGLTVTYHSQRYYEGSLCVCRCTNPASASVTLSLPAGSPFTVDSTSFTLSEEQSKTVQVTYHPTGAEGIHTADLTASFSAGPQTFAANLVGAGFVGQSNLNISVTSWDFGNTEIGVAKSKGIFIQNEGSAQLLGTLSTASPFGVSSSSFSVAPGSNYTFFVSFLPASPGPASGVLNVSSNDPDAPALAIALTGNGVQQYLGISTDSLDFGTIPAGESLTKFVRVTNLACTSCGDPFILNLSNFGVNGGFIVTPPADVSLAAGESAVIGVTFAPSGSGSKSGKLSFSTNDPLNANLQVDLSGIAVNSNLDPSLLSIDFGDSHLGATKTRTFSIRNKGLSTLTISGISAPSSRLTVVPSSASIAAGATQSFEARYTPTSLSATTLPNEVLNGQLTVSSNDLGLPSMKIDVAGRGVSPVMSVTPLDGALAGSQIDLGTLYAGDVGLFRLHATNTGNEPLTIAGATTSLSLLSAQGLPLTVAPQSTATFYARYAPAAEGSHSAGWTIASNDFFQPSAALALKATAVSSLDLAADRLEITQGIQDPDNSLPLLAGKRTVVRTFVASTIRGVANTSNTIRRVDGVLHVLKNGSEVPGSPLASQNGPISVVPSPDRKVSDATLNFAVPESFVKGTESDRWTFRADINPAAGGRVERLMESAYGNNVVSEELSLYENYKPVVHYFPLTFVDGSNHVLYALPNETRMAEGANLLKKIFPVSGLTYVRRNPIALREGWGNDKWFQALFFAAHLGNQPVPDRVYGWLPESFNGGRAEDIPGRVAYGGGLASPVVGQETFAHEMGHTYGLCHTHYVERYGGSGDRCFATLDGENYDDGHAIQFSAITEVGFDADSLRTVAPIAWSAYGSCCADVTCDNGLTYTDCTGAVQEGCHTSQCVAVTCGDGSGFTDCANQSVPAGCVGKITKSCSSSGAIDVMAYRQNSGQSRWIHPQRYQYLFQRLRSRAADPSNSRGCGNLKSCAATESRPSLLIAGQITSDGSAGMSPLYSSSSIPDLPDDGAAGSTPYTLRLIDAAGAALMDYPLRSGQASALEDADQPGPGGLAFSLVVPELDGLGGVQLLNGDDVLTERRRSAHAPAVTVTSPTGGELMDGVLAAAWNASDEDGDALTYSVLYSADGGASFRVLGVDLTDVSIAYDASRLPGGKEAFVRVIASDGFLTTSADSPPFAVGGKPPQLTILSPADGETVLAGAAVVLSVEASDLEDGVLTGSSIHWTSDTAGDLGFGNPLTANLTAGPHRITALAADSNGDETVATVSVLVADGAHAPRADAGPDQTVDEKSSITLDASTSSDPDEGDVLSYSWTQVSGPPVALGGANTAQATFTAPSVASDKSLQFEVEVTDADGNTATDRVTAVVKNVAFPSLILSTKEIDFGTVAVGERAAAAFTITNGGKETLTIKGMETSRTAFSADPTTATLEPGQSLDIHLTFRPAEEAVYASNLYVRSDTAAGALSRIVLKGTTNRPKSAWNDNGAGASLLPQADDGTGDVSFSPDLSPGAGSSAGGCSLLGGGF
ncbi:MAG TPA: choice-of-anchor D domain-containing protein [bacterium]|nr:choice-of-anchor D domain-containing protein [bacterium]